jgi:hypothetical protein
MDDRQDEANFHNFANAPKNAEDEHKVGGGEGGGGGKERKKEKEDVKYIK